MPEYTEKNFESLEERYNKIIAALTDIKSRTYIINRYMACYADIINVLTSKEYDFKGTVKILHADYKREINEQLKKLADKAESFRQDGPYNKKETKYSTNAKSYIELLIQNLDKGVSQIDHSLTKDLKEWINSNNTCEMTKKIIKKRMKDEERIRRIKKAPKKMIESVLILPIQKKRRKLKFMKKKKQVFKKRIKKLEELKSTLKFNTIQEKRESLGNIISVLVRLKSVRLSDKQKRLISKQLKKMLPDDLGRINLDARVDEKLLRTGHPDYAISFIRKWMNPETINTRDMENIEKWQITSRKIAREDEDYGDVVYKVRSIDGVNIVYAIGRVKDGIMKNYAEQYKNIFLWQAIEEMQIEETGKHTQNIKHVQNLLKDCKGYGFGDQEWHNFFTSHLIEIYYAYKAKLENLSSPITGEDERSIIIECISELSTQREEPRGSFPIEKEKIIIQI